MGEHGMVSTCRRDGESMEPTRRHHDAQRQPWFGPTPRKGICSVEDRGTNCRISEWAEIGETARESEITDVIR
jgi:hypothetical protein